MPENLPLIQSLKEQRNDVLSCSSFPTTMASKAGGGGGGGGGDGEEDKAGEGREGKENVWEVSFLGFSLHPVS